MKKKYKEYGISYDNLYNIYYGIISNRIDYEVDVIDDKLKEELDKFYSLNMVSIQTVITNQNESNEELSIKDAIGRKDYTRFLNNIEEQSK